MTTDHDETAQMLPGLGDPDPAFGAAGEVEAAARRTIAGLAAELDERHALACQALVTAARQLDRATATRGAKPYGVAELLAQLREWYRVLMPEEQGGGNQDALDQLIDEIMAAGDGGRAAVRDGPES